MFRRSIRLARFGCQLHDASECPRVDLQWPSSPGSIVQAQLHAPVRGIEQVAQTVRRMIAHRRRHRRRNNSLHTVVGKKRIVTAGRDRRTRCNCWRRFVRASNQQRGGPFLRDMSSCSGRCVFSDLLSAIHFVCHCIIRSRCDWSGCQFRCRIHARRSEQRCERQRDGSSGGCGHAQRY